MHQVVNTEPARAEQGLLIDAGRLTIRIADVRGGPSSRCARALRVNEFKDHTEETVGADVLRRVGEAGGSETNIAWRERVFHGRSTVERCACPTTIDEHRKHVPIVPVQHCGLAWRNVEQEDGDPSVSVDSVAQRHFVCRNRRVLLRRETGNRQRERPGPGSS